MGGGEVQPIEIITDDGPAITVEVSRGEYDQSSKGMPIARLSVVCGDASGMYSTHHDTLLTAPEADALASRLREVARELRAIAKNNRRDK